MYLDTSSLSHNLKTEKMKILYLIFMLSFLACSEPKKITFNPDDGAATSGTVGSAKATSQLPVPPVDTTRRRDSLRKQ
jgi:hypothetical protein